MSAKAYGRHMADINQSARKELRLSEYKHYIRNSTIVRETSTVKTAEMMSSAITAGYSEIFAACSMKIAPAYKSPCTQVRQRKRPGLFRPVYLGMLGRCLLRGFIEYNTSTHE